MLEEDIQYVPNNREGKTPQKALLKTSVIYLYSLSSTADDPFNDNFGGGHSHHRGQTRGSVFGFGSFPAFGPGISGFDPGAFTQKNNIILDFS